MNEREWLAYHFQRTKPWIEAALARDVGTHNIEDVWAALETGHAQLWPTQNAVCVTTIENYPRAKALRGWLAGGNLHEIVETEPVIRAWAKRMGCDLMLIGGRRGWLKAFEGYEEAHTVMARKL